MREGYLLWIRQYTSALTVHVCPYHTRRLQQSIKHKCVFNILVICVVDTIDPVYDYMYVCMYSFSASSEMKKKLYGSVLLIGGGLGFTQSSTVLQSRLEASLPVEFSKGSDTVEVSSNPRVCTVESFIRDTVGAAMKLSLLQGSIAV